MKMITSLPSPRAGGGVPLNIVPHKTKYNVRLLEVLFTCFILCTILSSLAPGLFLKEGDCDDCHGTSLNAVQLCVGLSVTIGLIVALTCMICIIIRGWLEELEENNVQLWGCGLAHISVTYCVMGTIIFGTCLCVLFFFLSFIFFFIVQSSRKVWVPVVAADVIILCIGLVISLCTVICCCATCIGSLVKAAPPQRPPPALREQN